MLLFKTQPEKNLQNNFMRKKNVFPTLLDIYSFILTMAHYWN